MTDTLEMAFFMFNKGFMKYQLKRLHNFDFLRKK